MKNYYVIASDPNRPDEAMKTVLAQYNINMPNDVLIDVLNLDEELIYTISIFQPDTTQKH
jgi:hypothetical protein